MGIPLSHLGLGTKAQNALFRNGIRTIEDVLDRLKSPGLLHLRHVGPSLAKEIEGKVADYAHEQVIEVIEEAHHALTAAAVTSGCGEQQDLALRFEYFIVNRPPIC
jgi:hypothetical protein